MKSAISLTLIMCLMMSAVPIVAQEPTVTTAGPLAHAVTREAVRLAADGEPASTIAPVQPGVALADANWSRVRKLPPGTEMTVKVKGLQPATRYIVSGDESSITVLNLTDPALPRAARHLLLRLASDQPDHLLAGIESAGFVDVDNHVRVGPDGVFVVDRTFANVMQVDEHIKRDDVVEIMVRVPYSPAHDALVGLGVGAAVFAGIGLLFCSGYGGCGAADVGPLLGGAALGGGMFAGFSVAGGATRHALHKTTKVIYRVSSPSCPTVNLRTVTE